MAIVMKVFFRSCFKQIFREKDRHHINTSTENKPICIHSSSQTLLNHVAFGNSVPGRVRRTVTIISHMTAAAKENFELFNNFFYAMISY